MKFRLSRSWTLVLLAVAIVAGFVYLLAPRNPALSFIENDVARDHARFTPGESVDVAMAMKLVTHAAPHMLNPPQEVPKLLIFPPSQETLASLSGR